MSVTSKEIWFFVSSASEEGREESPRCGKGEEEGGGGAC